MILEICAGLIILVCFVLIIYLLTRSRNAITIRKKAEGGNLILSLKANKDIQQVEVTSQSDGGEDIRFARKSLRKGDSVEFIFPLSRNPIQISITDESGNKVVSA